MLPVFLVPAIQEGSCVDVPAVVAVIEVPG